MLLFSKKKNHTSSQDYEERIMHLQLQREVSKTTIIKIRKDMQALIDCAVSADDLDRKILSLDYEEKKSMLATETEHFEDLNKLIRQLRSAALANERCRAFEQIASISDGIDTRAVLTAEDTVDIKRSMLTEELASLDNLLVHDEHGTRIPEENPEFVQLVQEATKKKNLSERSINAISAE